jgi:tRNA-modifying protein YgfZ
VSAPLDASRLRRFIRDGGVFELGPRTRIRVSGPDRVRYLNGQLSNNIKRLAPGEALPALVLTAKGKLCADVFAWIEDDAVIVDADIALAEILPARLERYAISDDVQFDVLPSDATGWHVFGVPATGLKINRLGLDGVDVFEPPTGLLQATPDEVEFLRIIRGVPHWGRELTEDSLPQEAGLERVSVDFHKGCYVGQETVSRIESIGRVNRQLTGFTGAFPPVPGLLVGPNGEKSGSITSAVALDGKTYALGFLQTRDKNTTFSVMDESGACLGPAECSEFPLFSA